MKNPQHLPLHIRLVELANAIVLDDIKPDFDPTPDLATAVASAEATIQDGKDTVSQQTQE